MNSYFTVSIDDGCSYDMQTAELLKKHGIRATFYIAPANRERKDRLQPNQIRDLSRDFEIGAHTFSLDSRKFSRASRLHIARYNGLPRRLWKMSCKVRQIGTLLRGEKNSARTTLWTTLSDGNPEEHVLSHP